MPLKSNSVSTLSTPSVSGLQFTTTEPMTTKSLALLLSKLSLKSSTDEPATLKTLPQGELVQATLSIPTSYTTDVGKIKAKLVSMGYSVIPIANTSPLATPIYNYYGPLDEFGIQFLVINGDTYLTDGTELFMIRESA